METTIIEKNGAPCAVIHSGEVLLKDVQSTLDFIMTVQYDTACKRVAVNKEAISEDFFRLGTGLAGEILQKFVNYDVALAIVGDFSAYTSKPLKDFIYESNQGRHIFFLPTVEEAVERLAGV